MEKDTSEIAKLTERIAKDPKSKLFVPLAEEYKKAGDIEMAIHVLTEGLKNNPGYVTARSSLGRLLIERGEFAGAQKELEEVIKAIPDNLLAQRKLGELYVLQGRGADALQRFKTCLTLNPGDKDLTAIVADLEAGKDVSARIPKPKLPVQPAETAKAAAAPAAVKPMPTPPGRPVPAGSAGVVTRPAEAMPEESRTPTVKPAASPMAPRAGQEEAGAPAAAASQAAQPAPEQVPELRTEAEVVEEIVELEPLENAPVPGTAPSDAGSGASAVLDEAGGAEPMPPLDIPGSGEFSLDEPAAGESAPAGDLWPEVHDAPAVSSIPLAAAPPAVEEPTDDINTNTLAELYIAQGFYDKAIEIYQGMLTEKPSNVVLQQKLEKLGAMAAMAGQHATFGTPEAAPKAYIPQAPEGVSREEEPPAAGPAVLPVTAREDAGSSLGEALQETLQQAEGDEASPGSTALEGAEEEQDGMQRVKGSGIRRKETIDRLESWLKNVIKEKP